MLTARVGHERVEDPGVALRPGEDDLVEGVVVQPERDLVLEVERFLEHVLDRLGVLLRVAHLHDVAELVLVAVE